MTARISQQQLESYLWGAATLLRGTIDAGDYKQFIFPLLFYKRLCDVYDEETKAALAESEGDKEFAAYPENHRFQIPPEAHWKEARKVAKNVGTALQNALRAIETANPDKLYGIFGDAQWTNKDRLSDAMLRDLIEHFSSLDLALANLPEDELGNGYEYLIKKFADDAGHTAAEFYTNRTVVHLMTEMLQPQPGESIYDPTCGSGGMLLSCIAHLRRQSKEWRNARIYGQERNLMTSSIARMNCFLHGIEDFRIERGDTLAEPKFVQGDRLQRFDIVLANPPYSIKQWDREAFVSDPWGRNIYGTPPRGRADYAFWQHILQSLAPKTGRCAILFPHGVLFRDAEADMRRKMVEGDIIECVIGLGPNLFYNSTMEACVVICRTAKPKQRRNKILFINAVGEVTRERAQSFLTDENIQRIIKAYEQFKDEPDFAKVATTEEIRANDFSLRMGFYVSLTALGISKAKCGETLSATILKWSDSRLAVHQALSIVLSASATSDPRALKSPPHLSDVIDRRFDRSKWTRVKFDEVVRKVSDRVTDIAGTGLIHYVGGEHFDYGTVRLQRKGVIEGSTIGPAFHMRFKPGHVLYVSRNPHLRKASVVDFEGICANTSYVCEAVADKLLPELLPFVMQTDAFWNFATEHKRGSTNPYLNWPDIAKFEFDLPPADQQRRIAEILWAVDECACRWRDVSFATKEHARATSDSIFETNQKTRHLIAREACDLITVGIVVKPASYYTDAETGVAALRSLNVFPGRFDLNDLVFLTLDGHEKHSKSELKKGDVVVVRTGRPGDAAVVTDRIAGMNLIDLILVRPKPMLLSQYLVEFLNSDFGRRSIYRGSAGTAQQHFNVSEFERLDIPVPSIDEQQIAVAQLVSLEAQIQLCQEQAQRLNTLETMILEMLLS